MGQSCSDKYVFIINQFTLADIIKRTSVVVSHGVSCPLLCLMTLSDGDDTHSAVNKTWYRVTHYNRNQKHFSLIPHMMTHTSDMLLLFRYDSTLLLRSSFSPSISASLRLSLPSCHTTGRPSSSTSTPPAGVHFPPRVDWLPL